MGSKNSKAKAKSIPDPIPKQIESVSTKAHNQHQAPDNYLVAVTNAFVYDIQQCLSNKYKNTHFDFFYLIPDTIVHAIINYQSTLMHYQIYSVSTQLGMHRMHSLEAIVWDKQYMYIHPTLLLLRNIKNKLLQLSTDKPPFHTTEFELYQSFMQQLDITDYNQYITMINNGIYAGNTVIGLANGSIYHTTNFNDIANQSMNFKKLDSLNTVNIIDIGAGLNHILFLSVHGTVYAMGGNDKGQLGLGYDYMDILSVTEPLLIEKFVENDCFISSISCGEQHSCCIDNILADIWNFGDNQYFQCSFDAFQHIYAPQRYVYQNKAVSKAECGNTFTMVLCCDGGCYGFGAPLLAVDKKKGKIVKKKYNRCVWTLDLRYPKKAVFKEMSVGINCTVLISENNMIYMFKHNVNILCASVLQMFYDLKQDSKLCKLIAGYNWCYFVFE